MNSSRIGVMVDDGKSVVLRYSFSPYFVNTNKLNLIRGEIEKNFITVFFKDFKLIIYDNIIDTNIDSYKTQIICVTIPLNDYVQYVVITFKSKKYIFVVKDNSFVDMSEPLKKWCVRDDFYDTINRLTH